MGLREEIRESSRLTRIRQGQDAFDWADIPSMPGIRVAMVPLAEAEEQAGLMAAAALDVPDNLAGIQARQRVGTVHDVWASLRMPNNLREHVFESPDAMVSQLEPTDIDYLFEQLVTLQDYVSPSLAKLSDKEVEELKKDFVAIDWKDLSGKQANALVLALSRLLPQLLQDKLFSPSYTSNSMSRTTNDESTSDVLASTEPHTV